jgi:hypothetical protein
MYYLNSITTDAKLTPLEVNPVNAANQYCILHKTSDGKLTPIQVNPVENTNKYCIIGKTTDNKLTPLEFIPKQPGLLYAGGLFSYPINRIGKWNGSSWTELDNSFNSGVVDIEFAGNKTYVALSNNFNPFNGVAVYEEESEGYTWNSVGHLNNPASSVCVYNGDVYASGSFGIKRFDGSNWVSIGDFDGSVYDMYVYGGYLYFTGDFVEINDEEYNAVGKYNGSFSKVGIGIKKAYSWSFAVGSSIIVQSGVVYVGGIISDIALDDSSDPDITDGGNIVQFNGSEWSRVANGSTSRVNDVHYADTLYIATGSGVFKLDSSIFDEIGSLYSCRALTSSSSHIYVSNNYNIYKIPIGEDTLEHVYNLSSGYIYCLEWGV